MGSGLKHLVAATAACASMAANAIASEWTIVDLTPDGMGTAMEGAQEVIEQFSTAADGQWPFYAGRFIRPDLIVSVDVVEGEQF